MGGLHERECRPGSRLLPRTPVPSLTYAHRLVPARQLRVARADARGRRARARVHRGSPWAPVLGPVSDVSS